MARYKLTFDMSTEEARQIAEKIEQLDQDKLDALDQFTNEGNSDILSWLHLYTRNEVSRRQA